MARKFLLTSCILDNLHKSAQHIPTVTSTSLHDLTFFKQKIISTIQTLVSDSAYICICMSSNLPIPPFGHQHEKNNTPGPSTQKPPQTCLRCGNRLETSRGLAAYSFFGGPNFESSIISYVVSQYFWPNKNIQKLYG